MRNSFSRWPKTEDFDRLRLRIRSKLKVTFMKLSARNQLKGKIVEVKKGATTAHVRIDIGGQTVTAAITNETAAPPASAPPGGFFLRCLPPTEAALPLRAACGSQI